MNILKYNKITLLKIALFSLIYTSCTKNFESINTHPYNPMEDDFTNSEALGALLPSMLFTMHYAQENRSQMIEQMVGGQYGGYFTTTNNWQGTNFGTFNPALDWVAVPFNTIMVDFNSNFIRISRVTQNKGYIYAWANIVRVASMMKVLDTYGPIPYTQIGTSDGDNIPFDAVQTVYHQMFDDLENSIEILQSFVQETNNQTNNPMSSFDLVYQGDFDKWIKFARSLKMRMAIRLSNVDAEYARERFNEAMAAGGIEINADNAYIPTEDNPYYKASFDWGDLAINASLSSFMNGFADPRRARYMTPAQDGIYRGVRMGIQNINKDIYSNPNIFSKPAFARNTPLLIFCAAETAFLRAEAALLGWIPGGDAQARTDYENGIRLSMAQHQVDLGQYLISTTRPAAYTDPASAQSNYPVQPNITVSWTDFGINENTKLEKIITQKWLANFPFGFESWANHRRTGFP